MAIRICETGATDCVKRSSDWVIRKARNRCYSNAAILNVVVVPSSRVQRALGDVSRDILVELRRLNDARELPMELSEVMQVLARVLEGLGGAEVAPDAAVSDAAMADMRREG